MRPGARLRLLRAALISTAVAGTIAPAATAAGLHAQARSLRPPGFADVARLQARPFALVAVDRAAGRRSARLLRAAGAVQIAPTLGIWRLRSRALMRSFPQLASAVRAVGADRPLHNHARRTIFPDPLAAQEWWLAAVGADPATPPGAGKALAIIDSGTDLTHPEFVSRPATTALNTPQTTFGGDEFHGTAVASVAGAPVNGIGMVGIYPLAALQVWDASPGGSLTVGGEVEGIDAAIRAGASVINISLGSSDYSSIEEAALLTAFRAGVLVVVAAGNEFDQGNPAEYPADLPHVLTVASTDEKNQWSTFSSSSPAVDLSAPGENMVVAVPESADPSGYGVADGTSFSSPIVAAAADWVWTLRPTLDVTQVFDLMRFSAREIGRPGRDNDTGFGLLDIPNALTRPEPPSDGQEPNDDIDEVKANGLFARATRPVTTATHRRASLGARLDIAEDPEDVYRVWVPARRKLIARVTADADVDVDLWRPGTPTVLVEGARRRHWLLSTSRHGGAAPETVRATNRTRRGMFLYLDVYIPRNGPDAASYRVSVRTAR